jgi:superfamily II DNA/RNA helicase
MTTPPAETSATFAALGVPDDLVAALRGQGVDKPFAVQAATLPDAIAGNDLCCRAPTGSGKTLAFGIPMVARVSKAAPHKPTGLVLVPTRELAIQVTRALVPMAKARRLWVLAVYGGAPQRIQVDALRRGASIVVATPGRLTDLLEQRLIDLSAVEVAVIDEADRMADMGFLPPVRKILDLVPPDRQTLLWSATLDGDVDSLVRSYQHDPVRHELAPEPADLDRMTHEFVEVERVAKIGAAAKVLRAHGQGIVFCRTRHGADRVARQLGQAGVVSAVVHGNRSQAQRERALEAFRRGDVQALVATDVAARGIHVDDVAVVVHFDPAEDPKDYVHRSGRTARAGGMGAVVSLVVPEDRKKAVAIQRALSLPGASSDPEPRHRSSQHAGQHPGPRPGPRRDQRPGARSSHGPKGRGARRPR